MTLTIAVDEGTETALRDLCQTDGSAIDALAARLLARAVRAAMPRPTYDIEAIKLAVAEFEEDELALADSDTEHRHELLEAEDRA